MTTNEQLIKENLILTWLVMLIILIFAFVWVYQSNHHHTPVTPATTSTIGPSDLKVEPSSTDDSTPITANPQQTSSSLEGASDSQSVQSGPSGLQPAGSVNGMSDATKQSLGL